MAPIAKTGYCAKWKERHSSRNIGEAEEKAAKNMVCIMGR